MMKVFFSWAPLAASCLITSKVRVLDFWVPFLEYPQDFGW